MDQETKDALRDIKLSIHELEARVMNLQNDSHPPVFSKDNLEELDARFQVLEAFFNNIKLITTENKEIQ